MPPKPKLAYKMEITKQSQTAGDNSTQMQAGVINNNYTIVQGIDETRAMEICQQQFQLLTRDLIQEAKEVAKERVEQFVKVLIPKLVEYDEQLKAFAEPSFIKTLQSAQKSAACTSRKADYDMLSDLLIHRLDQGENREQSLGISKAIEIVDQLSEEAVIGLSVCYTTLHLIPNADNLHEGLSAHDKLLAKIIGNEDLPQGERWIEHLDLLSVVRLTPKSLGSFLKLSKLKPQVFSKYFISGVKVESEEYSTITNDFIQHGLPLSCFVPHPLKSDYVMLKLPNENIDKIYTTRQNSDGETIYVPLSSEQKEVIKRAFEVSRRDESKNEQLVSKFMEEWEKFPTLNKVRIWWDALPSHFSITSIGRAISYAYIHSKDPNVPYWC